MTWTDLAEDHRLVAHWLRKGDDPRFSRGICNRAYYAAYAVVTACLPEGTSFGRGWRNPEHARLPKHVDQISGLSMKSRQDVKRALRRLRHRREDADYRPRITVDKHAARESLRDMHTVFYCLHAGRNR